MQYKWLFEKPNGIRFFDRIWIYKHSGIISPILGSYLCYSYHLHSFIIGRIMNVIYLVNIGVVILENGKYYSYF